MDLSTYTKEELEGMAAARGIVIEEGSGSGGSVLKADLAQALGAALEEEAEAQDDRLLCRVVSNKFSQDGQTYGIGSVIRVPPERFEYFQRMSGVPRLDLID